MAQEALVSGRGVVEIVEQRGLLSRERIDAILSSSPLPPADGMIAPPTSATLESLSMRRTALRTSNWPACTDRGLHEGTHCGALVVTDPNGSVRWHRGDIQRPVFHRSCAKPFQAVAMLDAGLRLAGAGAGPRRGSHTGEAEHVAGVRHMLAAAGLPRTTWVARPTCRPTRPPGTEVIRRRRRRAGSS